MTDEAAVRAAVRAELDARAREEAAGWRADAAALWPIIAAGLALFVWTVPWLLLGLAIEAATGANLRHGWPYVAWVAVLALPPVACGVMAHRRAGAGEGGGG